MSELEADRNLRVYDAPEVASHYAALDYLTACERLLFETYIPRGGSVLDLGVGGGRTTPYLAKRAARYVGADYAPAMVKACQAKFPGVEFVVADATDLSAFPKSSFDAVVFAFNGIDCIVGEQSRRKCLEQIGRLLKVGAVVIFSSHNPRAVLVRTRWSRDRIRQMARRFSGNSRSLRLLLTGSLVSTRLFVALAQASWATIKRAAKRIPTPVFWRGQGDLLDPAHGGLLTHYQTPDKVISELSALRFRPECVVGDDYPQRSHPFATDWYYYVFAKSCEK